jgi:hypothetical protein
MSVYTLRAIGRACVRNDERFKKGFLEIISNRKTSLSILT